MTSVGARVAEAAHVDTATLHADERARHVVAGRRRRCVRHRVMRAAVDDARVRQLAVGIRPG